jgi:DNA-binding HxlR family transcriptional regulator
MYTEGVTMRTYGQYCGFARALEVVGERWAMLIIRDLLGGPLRFTDLLNGLPGIPTNILTSRLKELEIAGIIERQALPRASGAGVAYQLTPHGAALEPAIDSLGRWGATTLREPRANEVVTQRSLMAALRATFQPKAAKGVTVSFEMHMAGHILSATIERGVLNVTPGPLPGADLVLDPGIMLKPLLAGELSPTDALKKKLVTVRGDRKLLATFVDLFQL